MVLIDGKQIKIRQSSFVSGIKLSETKTEQNEAYDNENEKVQVQG